jgi:hypothetical protein
MRDIRGDEEHVASEEAGCLHVRARVRVVSVVEQLNGGLNVSV